MNDEQRLEEYYLSIGYKDYGWVNTNTKAIEAMQKSSRKQYHPIGRCLDLVACHDLKVFVKVDSGD